MAGTGGDLTISFGAINQLYVPDAITYYIKAYCCLEPYGCAEEVLTQQAVVNLLEPLATPSASNKNIGYGTTATLTAIGTGQPGLTGYRWYSAATGGTLLKMGATFTTPALTSTKKYYLAAYNASCESPRHEITVCVGPNPNLAVEGSTVCNVNVGDLYPTGTITVKNSQIGVSYQVWGGRGSYYAFTGKVPGNGGDLTFTITPTYQANPPDAFNFDVIAYGCSGTEEKLNSSPTIYLQDPIWAPSANGVTISSGQTATLTAIPSGQFPPFVENYEWYEVATGGTPVGSGATFTTPILTATKTYYLAMEMNGCESPRAPVTVTVSGPFARRINSGGPAYTTVDGKTFTADGNFTGGSVSSIATGEVANTTEDALYRNLRIGAFSYNLPSGNGTFDVVLHFNETY